MEPDEKPYTFKDYCEYRMRDTPWSFVIVSLVMIASGALLLGRLIGHAFGPPV